MLYLCASERPSRHRPACARPLCQGLGVQRTLCLARLLQHFAEHRPLCRLRLPVHARAKARPLVLHWPWGGHPGERRLTTGVHHHRLRAQIRQAGVDRAGVEGPHRHGRGFPDGRRRRLDQLTGQRHHAARHRLIDPATAEGRTRLGLLTTRHRALFPVHVTYRAGVANGAAGVSVEHRVRRGQGRQRCWPRKERSGAADRARRFRSGRLGCRRGRCLQGTLGNAPRSIDATAENAAAYTAQNGRVQQLAPAFRVERLLAGVDALHCQALDSRLPCLRCGLGCGLLPCGTQEPFAGPHRLGEQAQFRDHIQCARGGSIGEGGAWGVLPGLLVDVAVDDALLRPNGRARQPGLDASLGHLARSNLACALCCRTLQPLGDPPFDDPLSSRSARHPCRRPADAAARDRAGGERHQLAQPLCRVESGILQAAHVLDSLDEGGVLLCFILIAQVACDPPVTQPGLGHYIANHTRQAVQRALECVNAGGNPLAELAAERGLLARHPALNVSKRIVIVSHW
ncbi:hypothetical protein A9G05_11970 [Pseudomonas sp. ENNP23]|nr:hypothetical protein A9G05_11970 [Pseudomonas sp. ENNP23]